MAIIDQVVVHRLIVQRLMDTLGDGSTTGVAFKLASDPDPELSEDPPAADDVVKWCRVQGLSLEREQRTRPVIAGHADNCPGSDNARLMLTVNVFCRVSAGEDSEYAMASALSQVAAALDCRDLVSAATPETTHQVRLFSPATYQDGEDESGLYVVGRVIVPGEATRGSGDACEVRPSLL